MFGLIFSCEVKDAAKDGGSGSCSIKPDFQGCNVREMVYCGVDQANLVPGGTAV